MEGGKVIIYVESFLRQSKSYQYIQALEECITWSVSYAELQNIYLRFPELSGDKRELRKVFFETITIKPPINEDWFKETLDVIISNKKNALSTNQLTRQIDIVLFEYYGLTEEERSIVLGIAGTAGFSETSIKETSLIERE